MSEAAPSKIVVIEDENEVRDLIEMLLRGAGHEVIASADSAGALELIKREGPDLVLCDIAMPGLDGYGVLSALRADPATENYPVVFLTAHREFTERVRAFKMGAVDYVTKPFTRETLLRKVERILKGLERRVGDEAAGAWRPVTQAANESRRPVAQPAERQAPARAAALPANDAAAAAEDSVDRDPPKLPDSGRRVPDFDPLPEMLRTVLIADDNVVFRKFLSTLLTAEGFTVYEAQDGEEALRIALERRPWLILTDVRMPGVDGFEFCRRVRAHSLISHTPILVLSGWDDYQERYRGLQLGADEFLSKDTPVREVLIRIHLLLQRYSDVGAPSSRRGVLEGGIEVVGAPGILQMWHQGRLSGVCTVRSGTQVFEARFREGEMVGARLGERTGADAVFAFLGWTRGHFRFVPGQVEGGEPLGESFDQLLLEGCRLLDEARRSATSEETAGQSG
jgi:DNA-binding response OmpR family regulator